jgi:hypothetical protein
MMWMYKSKARSLYNQNIRECAPLSRGILQTVNEEEASVYLQDLDLNALLKFWYAVDIEIWCMWSKDMIEEYKKVFAPKPKDTLVKTLDEIPATTTTPKRQRPWWF